MESNDVYLYGMTVLSTIHSLNGKYPEADSYGEIEDTVLVPGGETGNSAIILANFGLKVKVDGPYLGNRTLKAISEFFQRLKIDCSNLFFDPSFDGVQDLVIIDRSSRTVFGRFGHYFRDKKRWNQPDPEAINQSRIVGIDPFFHEESLKAAELAVASGKKYVSIDSPPDSYITRNAAAMVISGEFIRNNYPTQDLESLLDSYTSLSDGLIIFTSGSKEILYGRGNGSAGSVKPFSVDVKSTLGAGDTFRAGVLYGVLNNWDDRKTVRFAAATSACVCKRFPMALDPPGLDEITALCQT
ncbi:MAG: carbohydrate kinase family protein [Fibrobacter sp.]|nr:carbohydrate kinase family protein [Fibrobacter sp.]